MTTELGSTSRPYSAETRQLVEDLVQSRPSSIRLPETYRVDDVLRFHGRHPTGPTERVEKRSLRRALWIQDRPRILHVTFEPNIASIEPLDDITAEAAHRIVEACRRMLGLVLDPSDFERRASRDPLHRRLIGDGAGLRIPQTPTVFEALVWALVGQQVTVGFAATLRERLIRLAGREIGDLVAHPRPQDLLDLEIHDLRGLQFSNSKANYLIAMVRAITSGSLNLEDLPRVTAEAAERTLISNKGIGPWSAAYVMMRGCGFPDCVPSGDSGLTNALQRFHGHGPKPSRAQVEHWMRPFAPFRSLATAHLWRSLSTLPGGLA